jgi:PAT family beta-lactamase induction signal transducer AmpG
MVIGGYLVDRFGRLRVMRLLLGLYVVLHGAMALGGAGISSRAWLGAYVVLNELLYTLVTIAIFAVAMQLCWKRVAATQFTVYMTVSNLGSSAGAMLLGPLTGQGGFPLVWAVLAGSAVLALALLRTADLARHGVGLVALERDTSLARAAV